MPVMKSSSLAEIWHAFMSFYMLLVYWWWWCFYVLSNYNEKDFYTFSGWNVFSEKAFKYIVALEGYDIIVNLYEEHENS